jgi:hypothetical protein
VWFIIGAALGLPQLLGTPTRWPTVYVVEIVVCMIQVFGLHFADETPRYLVASGNSEEAQRVIHRWLMFEY